MTAKHTPGPWTCSANYSTRHYMLWDADGNYHDLSDDVAEMDANARLISAAPELYEALLTAEQELHNRQRDDGWNPKTERVVVRARAALAKARGEP